MKQEQVDVFMSLNESKLPAYKRGAIVKQLLELDDSKWSLLRVINFKNPGVALILSFFLGGLGLDRIYIGDITNGVGKLVAFILTLFLWWTIIVPLVYFLWVLIDFFLITGATKEKNYIILQSHIV